MAPTVRNLTLFFTFGRQSKSNTEAPTLYQEGRQRRGSVILTHSNIQFPPCNLKFLRVASKGHYPEELKGQISLLYEGFKRGNNYVHI